MKLKNIVVIALAATAMAGCAADHSYSNPKGWDTSSGGSHCEDVYYYATFGVSREFVNDHSVPIYGEPLSGSARRQLVQLMDNGRTQTGYVWINGGSIMPAPNDIQDMREYEFMSNLLDNESSEQSINSVYNACMKKFSQPKD